jgi:hypothetical protein
MKNIHPLLAAWLVAMSATCLALVAFLSLLVLGTSSACAQTETTVTSFAMPKVQLMGEKTISGRKVLRYEHESHSDWAYPIPQRDYFNVLPSVQATKKVPLRVILHGAGKSGDKATVSGLINKEKEMHFYGGEEFCVLYLDCLDNKKTDWWWGYHLAKNSGNTYKTELTPTEKRLLATIEWVVKKYDIDRNRIYLSGVSMGGSGSLGLGLCRGDIFAAINVAVPAGVQHMLLRMQNTTYPDPPPVVNYSSHIDKWSKDQEEFLDYAKKHKLLYIYKWGLFGHTTQVRKTDSVVNEFPWLEIVKNAAYPVFFGATTNQTYPGFGKKNIPDQQGQINGYFRWKNLEDSSDDFRMELRLVTKKELEKSLETPATTTVDVTLRRLQRFKVNQKSKFKWSMVRGKEVLQIGEVHPDKQGLITIQGLVIESKPATLVIKRN